MTAVFMVLEGLEGLNSLGNHILAGPSSAIAKKYCERPLEGALSRFPCMGSCWAVEKGGLKAVAGTCESGIPATEVGRKIQATAAPGVACKPRPGRLSVAARPSAPRLTLPRG